ncbi:MAG: isoprenylcysteine carboxylmethyltransferase family protein [Candidatus Zixiibacteriota bacterium]
MRRVSIFIYGVIAYAVFFVAFLYAIGFVTNLIVPKSIDSAVGGPLAEALIIDLALLALFAVQHSVMARPGFKKWWTRIIPKEAERPTFVLFASLILLLMFWQWRPIGGVIWDVQQPGLRIALQALGLGGFLIVLITTFLINHFDLFGLRQVWSYLRGREYKPLKFVTPGPYRYVRHPMYIGFILGFWSTPTMTVAHLVFAIMTTAYILVAIRLEERDLVHAHGSDYVIYRKHTPMIIPKLTPFDSRALVLDPVRAGVPVGQTSLKPRPGEAE